MRVELDFSDLIVLAVNFTQGAAAVTDIEPIHLGYVDNSLWLLQLTNGFQPLVSRDVKYFQGVIAECRHEEPVAFDVEGEMVNPSLHLGHFNGLLQPQRLRCLGPGQCGVRKNNNNKDDECAHKAPFQCLSVISTPRTQSSELQAARSLVALAHTLGAWRCPRQGCAQASVQESLR